MHDERHFVETYSLRQAWEVDLHPEEGCGGPLDLHLALEVDPRVLLAFEDLVVNLPDDDDPPDEFHFPLTFTWALPPLPAGPDLLQLALALCGIGGVDLPFEVSGIDAFPSATDAPERRITIMAKPAGVAGAGAGRRGAPVRRVRPVPRVSASTCSSRRRSGSTRSAKGRPVVLVSGVRRPGTSRLTAVSPPAGRTTESP